MADTNAQTAQSGVSAGKKVISELEKMQGKTETAMKDFVAPEKKLIINRGKKEVFGKAKSFLDKANPSGMTGAAKEGAEKAETLTKKASEKAEKLAKDAAIEAKAAAEKAAVKATEVAAAATGVVTLGAGTAAAKSAAAARYAQIDAGKNAEKAKNHAQAGRSTGAKITKVKNLGDKISGLTKGDMFGGKDSLALAKGVMNKMKEAEQNRE